MWLMERWAIQDARQPCWCGKGGLLDVEGALGAEDPLPVVSCGGRGAVVAVEDLGVGPVGARG